MADKKILLDLEVKGYDRAIQQGAELNSAIRANKAQIKELSKDYDKNAVEIQALNVENKRLAQSQRILTNTAKSVTGSYNDLSNQMATLKARQKDINVSTDKGQKKYAAYGKKINEINNKLKKLDATNGVHTRNVGNYQQALEGVTGQLNIAGVNVGMLSTQIKQASTAFQAMTRAQMASAGAARILKVALISTGIGAIVVALGSLITFLTTTQRGMDAVTSVTRPLASVFQVLLGVLQDLGGKVFDQLAKAINNPKEAFISLGQTIVNNVLNRFKAFQVFIEAIGLLMEGEFTAAMRKGADAFIQMTTGITEGTQRIQDFGKATADVIKQGVDIGTQIDQLTKAIENAQNALIISEGKLLRLYEEQAEILNDTNNTAKEREAAGIAALQAYNKLAAERAAIVQMELDLAKLKASQNDTDRQAQADINRLAAELDKIQAEAARKRKRITAQLNSAVALREKELALSIEAGKIQTRSADIQRQSLNLQATTLPTIQQGEEQLNQTYEKRDLILGRLINSGKEIAQVTSAGFENAIELVNVYSQFQQAAMQRELLAAGDNAKKREEIERKYAKRQQGIAIAQSVLNGALAVTKTLANLGLPAGAIASSIVALQTAAQIAIIRSQKFAKGGLTDGGMFEGASHAKGGIKFAVGGRIHEAEGGEAIINKRSTAMFKPVLSAINQAGGGKKFASGGMTGSPSINQALAASSQSSELRDLQSAMMSQKIVLPMPTAIDVQEDITTAETNATF